MFDKYIGHGLPEDTKTIVRKFYEKNEYSCAMPGAKDFVSICRNLHMQKRLLLCDVNEMYVKFKEEHPNVKICHSHFAALCPKWCINVDNTGSHPVCICVYYQNVKLMINACKLKTDEHTLIKLYVIEKKNKNALFIGVTNVLGQSHCWSIFSTSLKN